jgi:hypothetical protein
MKVRLAPLVLVIFFWAAPAFSPPAFGQGCAMCYSSAVAASKDGQKAISKAVLVLVLPPAGIMTLGVALAYRYGKKRDLENG